MRISKVVSIPGIANTFSVIYIQQYFTQRDSEVKIYDTYKISILLSDGLAAVVNDKVIDVGKYSILFFRPDEIHFGRFFRPGMYSYLDFLIPISFCQNLFGHEECISFLTDTSADRVNYIVSDTRLQTYLSNLVQDTINTLTNGDLLSEAELFSIMMQILLQCSKAYDLQKNTPLESNIPKFVNRTLQYIAENYAMDLSLNQLAAEAGCSVAYLSRTFRQHTGKTIYNHIIDTRIGNAQILLRSGKSVTETCTLVGFEDCSNFIKTFKKLTGKTPLQFKNKLSDQYSF